jgi:hypothetical protein
MVRLGAGNLVAGRADVCYLDDYQPCAAGALESRWYREHFPAYPPERRALASGVW